MDLGVGAFPAEIAIEAGDPRRRLVTPAVILDTLRGKIEAPFSIPDAVLQPTANATVGAARGVEFRAAIGEAVLHLEANRAAECVETEGRVIGPDVGAADGNVRDEVPVDCVAEGFVDAHTLHVDREPLRSALQRRGGEAAIAQSRGELVALGVAYEHPRNTLIQRLGHVWRIDPREVLGGERLHHGRHLVAVEAEPGYRRGGDNLERRNLGRWCGRGRGRGSGRGDTRGWCRPSGRVSWGWPPDPRRRRTRGRDNYLRQRLPNLGPGYVQQHQGARQRQRANRSALQQTPFAGR